MVIPVTERTDITRLLGMNWMKRFKLTIVKIQLADNSQSEKEEIINLFPNLLDTNVKNDTKINIHMRPKHFPMKQKSRQVPLKSLLNVGRELENLKDPVIWRKNIVVDEPCFVSPVVITVECKKFSDRALLTTGTKIKIS